MTSSKTGPSGKYPYLNNEEVKTLKRYHSMLSDRTKTLCSSSLCFSLRWDWVQYVVGKKKGTERKEMGTQKELILQASREFCEE